MAYFDVRKIRNDTITLFRREPDGVIYARFWIKAPNGDGKQVMRSLNTRSNNECEQIANDLLVRMNTTVELGASVTKLSFKALWAEFIKAHKKRVDAELASKNVYDTMLYSGKFLIPHFGKMQAEQISESEIDEFKIWRRTSIKGLLGRKGKVSAYTINMHLRHLKMCLVWGKTKKRITLALDPRDIKGVKRVTVKRPAFTNEQFARLHERLAEDIRECKKGTDDQYYASLIYYFVRVLTATGMRPGELQHLKWSNMSLIKDDEKRQNIIFHVEKSKTESSIGKRDVIGRLVTYKLIEEWKHYAKYKKQTDYIFPNIKGKVAKDIDMMFAKRLKRCHLTHSGDGRPFSLYSCRHTYVTLSIRYGKVDTLLLAKNCGTSLGQIERHYGQVSVRDVATKLGGTGLSWGDEQATKLLGFDG